MMVFLKQHHKWFDNLDPNPRFLFFMFVVVFPFILAGNLLFSSIHVIALIARTIFFVVCLYSFTRVLYMHSDPDFVPRTKKYLWDFTKKEGQ